ncbi:hypothetical protein CW304_27710 [Bacillus sp. UFRGS-B20]|nr:hypothetical protein CW304_27710 [Bacillus sp. UFRGS-B20]
MIEIQKSCKSESIFIPSCPIYGHGWFILPTKDSKHYSIPLPFVIFHFPVFLNLFIILNLHFSLCLFSERIK